MGLRRFLATRIPRWNQKEWLIFFIAMAVLTALWIAFDRIVYGGQVEYLWTGN